MSVRPTLPQVCAAPHQRTHGRAPRATAPRPTAADRTQRPTPRYYRQPAAHHRHAPPAPTRADRARVGQSHQGSSRTTKDAALQPQTMRQHPRTRPQTPRRSAPPPTSHRSPQSRTKMHRQSHPQRPLGGHRDVRYPAATTPPEHAAPQATEPRAHGRAHPKLLQIPARPCGTIPSKAKTHDTGVPRIMGNGCSIAPERSQTSRRQCTSAPVRPNA